MQAIAFNQGFDLNDPNTPDYIFGRINAAYDAAYQRQALVTGNPAILNGPLRSASTQRERDRGIAFGFRNSVTGQAVDYNLSNAAGAVLNAETRSPIFDFNIPEAVLLQSSADSIYHGLQLGLTKRFSRGLQFNTSDTWSKSIDYLSSDPGSTSGGGKPDVPNTGFVVQGNQRDLSSNRAVSDFDRNLPLGTGLFVKGWEISGFAQIQSGSPFSIFSPEPEVGAASAYTNLRNASGGLYRLGFGRPSLCGTLDQFREQESDITEGYINPSVLCSPLTAPVVIQATSASAIWAVVF